MDFAPCGDYGTAFSSEIVGGKPKGIGLSQWRVNLGGGSAAQGEASGIEDKSRRAESYLTDDLTYDHPLRGTTLLHGPCQGAGM